MCQCVLEWMWLERRKHLFNLTFFFSFFFLYSKHLLYFPRPPMLPPLPRTRPLFNWPRQTWTGSKLQNRTVVKEIHVLCFCKLAHFSLYWDCIKHLSFSVLFNSCVIVGGGRSSPPFSCFLFLNSHSFNEECVRGELLKLCKRHRTSVPSENKQI